MRLIDEQFLETQFYGARRLCAICASTASATKGYAV